MNGFSLQEIQVSSRKELYDKANLTQATRCGATKNPHKRKYGYSRSRSSMSGTMYYLKVDDQYIEENQLLKYKKWKKNKHTISNIQQRPGYIYVIVENY